VVRSFMKINHVAHIASSDTRSSACWIDIRSTFDLPRSRFRLATVSAQRMTTSMLNISFAALPNKKVLIENECDDIGRRARRRF
jgi:hypothetical protein